MNLFHGALSDSFGRRPVVLWGVAAVHRWRRPAARWPDHRRAGVLARGARHVGGAGMVVSRAVIRDMFPPGRRAAGDVAGDDLLRRRAGRRADGRRLPVRARRLALDLLVPHRGRRAAVVAELQAAARDAARERSARPSSAATCCAATGQLGSSPRFVMLALASGVPFNGMFLYVLSAPVFLGEHLHLGPTQFFWFFVPHHRRHHGRRLASAAGWPGASRRRQQIRHGFVIMVAGVAAQRGAEPAVRAARLVGAAAGGGLAFGWALMVPVVTLMVLDLAPDRRGMASSLQACIGSLANGAGRRRDRAAGDAFHGGAGRDLAAADERRRCRLALGQAAGQLSDRAGGSSIAAGGPIAGSSPAASARSSGAQPACRECPRR